MALSKTAEPKYKYGNKDFPILYEDIELRVFKNPNNDVFVEDIASGVIIRLSSFHRSFRGLLFTTEGRVEPIKVGNGIGWHIFR